jgi:hypothetical protein
MKRLSFVIMLLLLAAGTWAKVVKVTMADGTTRIFGSAELESIDFADDGTIVLTTWDGKTVDLSGGMFEEVNVDDEAAITEIRDTLMVFPETDVIYSRQVKQVNFVYPSADPQGNPATLSAAMLIPEDIWNGYVKCDGIILGNHFTASRNNQAPTKGYFLLEGTFLSCPVKLNYIFVESDFFGFGVTERYPQAFIQGTANGRASIDALLTARELLQDMGIDYGPFLFNMGYSSGGFDAIATQKVRDMEYRDEIWFDKTFAGGGPYDIGMSYKDYITTNKTAFMTGIALMVVATNETQKLGLDYADMFNPPFDEKLPAWVLDKKMHQFQLNDSIMKYASTVSDLVAPAYANMSSPQAQELATTLNSLSLTTGWNPDASQKLYIIHSRDDDYVPFASAQPLVSFLKRYGYSPNAYAGRTNFQANFAFKKLGHIEGAVLFFLESLCALKAWPTVYDTNHRLKDEYSQVLANENRYPFDTKYLMNNVGIDTNWLKNLPKNMRVELEGMEDFTSGSMMSVMDMLDVYNSLLPASDEEEAAMNEDCGVDVRTYLRRLRNLLLVIGLF